MRMHFKNRTEAGQRLAEKLLQYKQDNPVVFALPRGGVPVGYEVAEKLNAPLDILVARKIGLPENPEFAVGAIAPNDVIVINQDSLNSFGFDRKVPKKVIEKEKEEMKRRINQYKSGEWSKGTSTDTLIIVDDGLATGLTARAALESARISYKPKKLIFASPVCALDSLKALGPYADEIISVIAPKNLMAIGEWYDDFPQTSDEEVLYYLNKRNNRIELDI